MTEEFFRSPDLVARARVNHGSDHCVITFDSYTDIRDLGRPGFGESFFNERRIDAIHILSRDNNWYQHPEIEALTKQIAARTSSYRRVLAYGSSMGGYGSLRLGRVCGANVALALSPQYSIDPNVVPFERRWLADAARIAAFPFEKDSRAFLPAETYIAFDPFDSDRRHVALYAEEGSIIPIRAPFAGHPVTGFLAESGLLQPLVLDVLNGEADAKRFERLARLKRKDTSQYYYVLSNRIRSPQGKLVLARRAARRSPENLVYLTNYATALSIAGERALSESQFRNCLALFPDNPVVLYQMSEMYERAGELDAAVAQMRYLLSVHPDAPVYEARLRHLVTMLNLAKAQRSDASIPMDVVSPTLSDGPDAIDRHRLAQGRSMVARIRQALLKR